MCVCSVIVCVCVCLLLCVCLSVIVCVSVCVCHCVSVCVCVCVQLAERLSAAAQGVPQPGWDFTSFPKNIAVNGSRQYLGPRLYLYSAHDTTVAAVLSGLGLFDGCDSLATFQLSLCV